MKRFIYSLAIFAICSTLSPPGYANSDPRLSSGLSQIPMTNYGVDSVGTFNGSLNLSIPIGQRYQAAPDVSYGFHLSYNSNSWKFFDKEETDGNWLTAEPSDSSNAGIGWTFLFGDLLPKNNDEDRDYWTFISPDGGTHRFYKSLREGDDAVVNEDQMDVLFTRDNSYMRLTEIAPSIRDVEASNGVRYRFFKRGGDWQLEQIWSVFDQATPSVSIAYTQNDEGNDVWTITDKFGRVHTVHFQFGKSLGQIVDKIQLAGYDGELVTYDLSYKEEKRFRPTDDINPHNSNRPQIAFLTEIELPDGTRFTMLDDDGNASYYDNGSDNAVKDETTILSRIRLPSLSYVEWDLEMYEFPNAGGETHLTEVPGVSERRVLDKHGDTLFTWTYRGKVTQNSEGRKNEVETHVVNPNGSCEVHYYAAETVLNKDEWSGWEFALPVSLNKAMKDGMHRSSRQYSGSFSTGSSAGYCDAGSDILQTRFVLYEHDKLSTATGSENRHRWLNSNRRVVRNRTDIHDANNIRYISNEFSEFDGLGHYQKSSHTDNFRAAGGGATETFTTTTNYTVSGGLTYKLGDNNNVLPGWDNAFVAGLDSWLLGLYDQRLTEADTGNVGLIGSNRVVTQYGFDQDTGYLECERKLVSNELSGETGIRNTNDILIDYVDYGNASEQDGVTDELKVSGGDTQDLNTASICSGPINSNFRYKYIYTYDPHNGMRTTTTKRGNLDGEVWVAPKSLNVERDANTGLITLKRQSTNAKTTYVHDNMGRVLQSNNYAASDENLLISQTINAYTPVSQTDHGEVTSTTTAFLESGTERLHESKVNIDELGRSVEQHTRLPDAAESDWSVTKTYYDSVGRVDKVSMPNSASNFVVYSGYDLFDRPTTITQPDGKQLHLDFEGIRKVTSTVSIATLESDIANANLESNQNSTSEGVENLAIDERETDVHFVQVFDGFGRIVEVQEASDNTDSTLVSTEYFRDVMGQLTKVKGYNPHGNDQTREFVYDNRGLMIATQQPELGGIDYPDGWEYPNGDNGVEPTGLWHTYSNYDAIGNLGNKNTGTDLLNFTYDPLGRMIRTSDGLQQDRPLLEYSYVRGLNRIGVGNIESATRHNYGQFVDFPDQETDIQVTENYTYGGTLGGVVSKTTSMAPLRYVFNQSWTYDEIGRRQSVTFPTACDDVPECPFNEPERVVEYQYQDGTLVALPGWTDVIGGDRTIRYHDNGLFKSIPHSNGTEDTFDVHNNHGMPRLRKFQAFDANAELAYNSGNFIYDGVGNIKNIGGREFAYDGVNRLVKGAVSGITQQYDYDVFGNMTQKITIDRAGISTVRDFQVDAETNRLDEHGATYDSAGRLTEYVGIDLKYDPLGKLVHSDNDLWQYVYTASGERIMKDIVPNNSSQTERKITIRDLDNQVLRIYTRTGDKDRDFKVDEDFIHGPRGLLASVRNPGTVVHYHLDHLGSPILSTDANGNVMSDSQRAYLPFGEEVLDEADSGNPTLQFTGHQRDVNLPGPDDNLDYMHARYYNPNVGRFNRPDPVLGQTASPQSWNRYAYVQNNPMGYTDPSGRTRSKFIEGCSNLFIAGNFFGKFGKGKVGTALAGLVGTFCGIHMAASEFDEAFFGIDSYGNLEDHLAQAAGEVLENKIELPPADEMDRICSVPGIDCTEGPKTPTNPTNCIVGMICENDGGETPHTPTRQCEPGEIGDCTFGPPAGGGGPNHGPFQDDPAVCTGIGCEPGRGSNPGGSGYVSCYPVYTWDGTTLRLVGYTRCKAI